MVTTKRSGLLFWATTVVQLLLTAQVIQAQPQIPAPSPGATSDTDGTFEPTTTWAPTLTPFPTITAFPTYQYCNVCGDQGNMTNPDDVLYLPTANITCAEAQVAGEFGELPSETCSFLQLYIYDYSKCGCELPPNATITAQPTLSPVAAFPACPICPQEDEVVNNLLGVMNFGNSTLHCGFAEEAGAEGLWSPDLCLVLQNVSDIICDCGPAPPSSKVVPGNNSSNTPAPTIMGVQDEDGEEESTCYICGSSDYQFVNMDAQVPVPFEFMNIFEQVVGVDDPFRCGNLEQVQDVPAWEPLVCAFLQQTALPVCGCEERLPTLEPSNATTPTPTLTPTPAPTTTTTTTTTTSDNDGADNASRAPPAPPVGDRGAPPTPPPPPSSGASAAVYLQTSICLLATVLPMMMTTTML